MGGCSEVEIDCLTGDHIVLKTTIVMEQLCHSQKGELLTRGPGAYKIPAFGDIPREFNVSLLRGSSNPRAVFSSKAVGEPPLFLASSVFFAIKDAIQAARKHSRKYENGSSIQ